ncbi:hypothetical protein MKX07_005531 [Trichoderma sp. CBMAI-0711]|nr:hypothetical protein MKX07_005531 [Trichoderma sp. CBMAI-0711]
MAGMPKASSALGSALTLLSSRRRLLRAPLASAASMVSSSSAGNISLQMGRADHSGRARSGRAKRWE